MNGEAKRRSVRTARKTQTPKMDLSRFDAAPLIAFTAPKETDFGTETDGRIPARCGAHRADQWAYAAGGDVFVLDMDEPKKIIDIARRMIVLSGRSVMENGEGDIEIKIVGLRSGEKLFEELLIDDGSLISAPHEKILRAEETRMGQNEVAVMLKELNKVLEAGDAQALRNLAIDHIEGYGFEPQLSLPVGHDL